MTEDRLNENAYSEIGAAFVNVFRAFGLAAADLGKEIVSTVQTVWAMSKLRDVSKARMKFQKLVEAGDVGSLSERELRELGAAFDAAARQAGSKLVQAAQKAQQRRQSMQGRWNMILQPARQEVLMGEGAVILFALNPPLYLSLLGAKVLADPNPMFSFRDSDIGQSYNAIAARLDTQARAFNSKLELIATGFGLKGMLGESLRPRALNESTLDQWQGDSEPEDVFHWFESTGMDKLMTPEANAIIAERIEMLKRWDAGMEEQVKFLHDIAVEASSEQILRMLESEGRLSGMMESFLEGVDEALADSVRRTEMAQELGLQGDISEVEIRSAVREKGLKELTASVKANAEKDLKFLELGAYVVITEGMPRPDGGKEERTTWEIADSFPAAAEWKRVLTEWVSRRTISFDT